MQLRHAAWAFALSLCSGGAFAFTQVGELGATLASARTPHDLPSIMLPPTAVAAPSVMASMVGVLLAERVADVAPYHPGRLRTMNVRLGERVQEGQLLGALDITVTRFDVSRARAELKVLRAEQKRAALEAAQSRKRHQRRQGLLSASLVSGEEEEAARYQELNARLRVDGLRAQRQVGVADVKRLLQANADADVRAPFAGIVSRRYVDPGASVDTQTPIVRIVGDGGRFVRFAAPDAVAKHLHPGAEAVVRTSAGEIHAIVARIAPEVDTASRTVAIEATLPADAETALVGEMVHVVLPAEGR
jgi:RND family efflux transporter MFP subunit